MEHEFRTLYTADELIDKAWKYRTYWGSKGGITVSGGEPLLQIDFLLELFQKAKERGINHNTGYLRESIYKRRAILQ